MARRLSRNAKSKPAMKSTKAIKAEKIVVPLTKVQPSDNPRTKREILSLLSDTTGLSKKEVGLVFESLSDLISKDVGKKGCGLFTVPGLMRLRRVTKPATKARKGINPFTGEETVFKAKPARSVVKIRPLKALKEMV